MTEIGLVGIGIGSVFFGPASFLLKLFGWTSQRIWLVFVSSAILGAFFGASLMPTFNEMHLAAS